MTTSLVVMSFDTGGRSTADDRRSSVTVTGAPARSRLRRRRVRSPRSPPDDGSYSARREPLDLAREEAPRRATNSRVRRALARRVGLVATLAFLACVAACSRKGRVHDELRTHYRAWYQEAWGQPMAADETEEFERRFDCMWRELDEAGSNPERDLACLARRLEAQASCFHQHASDDPSVTSAECGRSLASATCDVSPAFEQTVKMKCRPASKWQF